MGGLVEMATVERDDAFRLVVLGGNRKAAAVSSRVRMKANKVR